MTEPSKTPRTDAAMAVVYDRTINADCDAIRAAIEPIEVELTAARLSLSESVDSRKRMEGLLREMKKAMLGYPMSTRALSSSALLAAINNELREGETP